jgi:hypothetical protein
LCLTTQHVTSQRCHSYHMASKQTNLDKVNLHDTPSQADVYAAKSQADTKPS